MAHPRIIGLAGKAGVGKTTLALALEARFGYERASFASLLRGIAEHAFGVNVEGLATAKQDLARGKPGNAKDPNGVRSALWQIGAALRAVKVDGYPPKDPVVEYAMRFPDMGVPPSPNSTDVPEQCVLVNGLWYPKVVFDDVRRDQEVNGILDRGGVVVFLDGPTLWDGVVPESDFEASRSAASSRSPGSVYTLNVSKAAAVAKGLRDTGHPHKAQPAFANAVLSELAAMLGMGAAAPVEDLGEDPEF